MYPHHGVPLPGEGGGAVLHEVVHVSQGAGVVLVRRQDLPQLLVPALTRDLGGEQVKISGGCTKIFAVPTSTGVAPCTLVTVRAWRAPGQSSSAQVRRSRPCAALKWSRVGSSLWSRPWLGGPELDVLELKERSGKPCRGMLACRLCVSCSSSWKTQVL